MIFIKLNWNIRLKNKAFLMSFIALITSFIYEVLAMFDIIPCIKQSELTEVLSLILNILAMIGVVVDPTTKGLGDTEKDYTYYDE